MHKLIFVNLQQFAGSEEKWQEWLSKANLSDVSVYVDTPTDLQAKQLLLTAAKLSHLSLNQFLRNFGMFVAPRLISQFSHYIDKTWDVLDFLEHTEEYIHKEVRNQIRGANPPTLRVSRLDKDNVMIRYSSSLKMCHFAEGLVESAATFYKQKVLITQPKCMLNGNAECEILVTRV
ncbi:MAG: heme NO-binding domain-containing protein [Thaumarchaeota archaeon]|nr:heme NO-binding domain-containing protein [Nitrososphaerota archaeon]